MAKKKSLFEHFSTWATVATGSSGAFIIAIAVIIIWMVSGPIFKYSDTWQLVINTSTTIITFLMVFLIQKSQNKKSKAIHLKLNEILASHEGTSNRMVDIEDLTELELDHLHKFYKKLSDSGEQDDDITRTHSIDAADENQKRKDGRGHLLKRIRPRKQRLKGDYSLTDYCPHLKLVLMQILISCLTLLKE